MSEIEKAQGVLIGLDWGTTNVRATLMNGVGDIIAERHGESGVGSFVSAQFATRFDELTEGWSHAPSIAAGMVGSRQGWKEAAYLPCPTGVDRLGENLTAFEHDNREISIVPGLKMVASGHLDVMRGEETQIAGFLFQNPNFSGTLVMPGTHSKWVRLNDGVIERFTTYMTGDLFNALSEHSILRHSVDTNQDNSKDHSDFVEAVSDTFVAKGSNMSRFFDIRANTLLVGTDNARLRERLSGLLIGMELQAAAEDSYNVEEFCIIGSGALVERYKWAGEALSAKLKCYDGSSLIWPALFDLAVRTNMIKELT